MSGFPARYIFLNNLDFKLTMKELVESLARELKVDPANKSCILVQPFLNDGKFNGTVLVEFSPPLAGLSKNDFERLDTSFKIEGRKVHVKQDRGESRHPDGSFTYKKVFQNRGLDGQFASCGAGSKTRVLDYLFLATLGITNEFKRQVYAGPFEPCISKLHILALLRQHGPLARDAIFEVKDLNNSTKNTTCTYVHAMFKYSLSAVQAIAYLHGKPVANSIIVPHVKMEHQLKPLKQVKCGIGTNGVILNIESQMKQSGFIDLSTVNSEALRKDLSGILKSNCVLCCTIMKPVGFHADFDYWMVSCENCNPTRSLSLFQKADGRLINDRAACGGIIPLAQIKMCYNSTEDYIEAFKEMVAEEKKAEFKTLSSINESLMVLQFKTIDINEDAIPTKYDILLFAQLANEPSFDLNKHRRVRLHSMRGNTVDGNSFPAWCRKSTILDVNMSGKNWKLVLRLENMEAECPFTNGLTMVPRVNKANYESLKKSLDMLIDFKDSKICQQIVDPTQLTSALFEMKELFPKALERQAIYQQLNTRQREILQIAWNSEIYFLVGPPGTGKTFFIGVAAILHAIHDTTKKVLICAPSNYAADNIMVMIQKLNSDVPFSSIRMYSETRQDDNKNYMFPVLHQQVSKLMDENEEVKRLRVKTNSKPVYEYKKRERFLYQHEKSTIENQILSATNIIVCTIHAAAQNKLNSSHGISTLILDEAGQATDPLCLTAIFAPGYIPKRCLFVGDPKQLPPCVLSDRAKKAGYGQSLMERQINYFEFTQTGEICSQLNIQYRMHPVLSKFVSTALYNDSLKNGVITSDRVLCFKNPGYLLKPLIFSPLLFVKQERFGEERVGTSFCNRGEALIVRVYLQLLLDQNISGPDIGILTFYDAQSTLITDLLKAGEECTARRELFAQVEVANVDAYQGREKDIIIVSCVRQNQNGEIGFLRYTNRINVGISRARKALIIIGSEMTLTKSKDTLWHDLLSYCKTSGSCIEFVK